MVFSERARETLALAEEEAHLLRHQYLGTEHLVLGLVRQRVPQLAHLDIDELRAAVVGIIGLGDRSRGALPVTPRVKKSLELAERETTTEVEPIHLLRGVLREGEGVGIRVLVDLGEDPESLARVANADAPGQGGFVATLGVKDRMRWRWRALRRRRDQIQVALPAATEDEDPEELSLAEAVDALRALAGANVYVTLIGRAGRPGPAAIAAMAAGPLDPLSESAAGWELTVAFPSGQMRFVIGRDTFTGASRANGMITVHLDEVDLWINPNP